MRLHLVVARNVLEPEELKFFVCNGPMETLLLVAFSRWRVERCFEDDKSEIGLDQYEGRRYLGLKRHLIISAVSYLFLARVRQHWAKKKPELTVCQLHKAMAALVRSLELSSPKARGELLQKATAKIRYVQHRKAQARKSHWKRALEKLRQLGITLSELKRCTWDTT
jgi:hypothetical protein